MMNGAIRAFIQFGDGDNDNFNQAGWKDVIRTKGGAHAKDVLGHLWAMVSAVAIAVSRECGFELLERCAKRIWNFLL